MVLQGELRAAKATVKMNANSFKVTQLAEKSKLQKQKIVLAVLSLALVGSLAVDIFLFTQQLSFTQDQRQLLRQKSELRNQLTDLQNQTANLENEKRSLQNQAASLEQEAATLQNQTTLLQNQNANLQNRRATLQNQLSQPNPSQEKPPTLVTRLGARDMRYNYSGQDLRLYISGEVWNVGTVAAQNCRLHVTLFQGENVAKDAYIELGTINAGSYVDVARNIYYTGEALTNWTITPEHN
jgi:hypothetical protein